MNRYLVFAFFVYYPSGGMNDFIDSIDSLNELREVLTGLREDQFHVYDTLLKEYVIEDTFICDYLK